MNAKRPIFQRPALAESLARDIAGESFVDYSSGLFLAAPRRTGKSRSRGTISFPSAKSVGGSRSTSTFGPTVKPIQPS
jgi:hypothetical protein